MKAVCQWIHENPAAFKTFLMVALSWIGKIVFAVTGHTASLGAWGAVIDQGVDVLVGGITLWGVVVGINHVSRGPSLTSMQQAETIVAAIKGPPVSESVTEVKAIAEDVADIPRLLRNQLTSNSTDFK